MQSLVGVFSIAGTLLLASCLPSRLADESVAGARSRMASITMPVPDKLKNYIGPDKINAYDLSITPGACDQGVTGTTIRKVSQPLDLNGVSFANEKLRQGCAYTLVIALGRADQMQQNLAKIYLSNDLDGRRTEISAEQTRTAKINVTAYLYITNDGAKDLGLSLPSIPIPSSTHSDVDISIGVGGGQPPQNQQIPPGDYSWRENITFVDVPLFAFNSNDYGSAFYRDVMTRTPADARDFQAGPSTHCHETMHGLQNAMYNKTPARDFFFYFENGKGAYVVNPVNNLPDVKNHIGDSFKQLASSRYQLYLISQAQSWKETLYIYDEWNSYVGTTRSAYEIKKAGRWDNSNADPIEGLADFMYFCSASLLSIKNVDPNYLATNKQFKAAFAMIMEQSVFWMNTARPEWPNSAAFRKFQNLQTAADAQPVRDAVRELMGAAWTKRVMGF
jgi:hypothetical protein